MSRVFSIGIFCVVMSTACFGQYRLSGTVTSTADSTGVADCIVYLDNEKFTAISDSKGRFVFPEVNNGAHTLHFVTPEFNYSKLEINVSDRDQFVKLALTPREQTLKEVEVTDVKADFGFTRMRAVENMGIYEGKKTEVILPAQLTANTATNNARQVYARVAGLNIWENDGAGIQLSIGGRGLDPNRTANFNVRQNGYDISADALGYPESYYTPPVEGIGRIEIIRGAASLQYGTQFGGLVNFQMKKPVTDKKLELTVRQTGGSYKFYNSFTSASGTINKFSYYTFFQYKRGDGWRDNSGFDSRNFYSNINYVIDDQTKIGIDFTHMNYLAQQPGGLDDNTFFAAPRTSIRERNWFKVNWNLMAIHLDRKISDNSEFNLRLFGLNAYRYSVGYNQKYVMTGDDGSRRQLITGRFDNIGAEARFLKRYNLKQLPSVLLIGSRYYNGQNINKSGWVYTGTGADFKFENEDNVMDNFRFPNQNMSLFIENILHISDKFSITPGIRYEYIHTRSKGYSIEVLTDNAGNEYDRLRTDSVISKPRQFVIGGLGLTYRPSAHLEVYSNISQNYKSISFNNVRFAGNALTIDPNMDDERGYSFDFGVRSEQTALFNYDVSAFFVNYANRIGEYDYRTGLKAGRYRTNVGKAMLYGIEGYGEADILGLLSVNENWRAKIFANIAVIDSEYKTAKETKINGKKVEFIPLLNLKTGVNAGYKNFKTSLQFTYMSQQYADASNADVVSDPTGVIGVIYQYQIVDLSASYDFKRFRIEGSINNLLDEMYFTRRATGYPGPGILPSDGRSFFLTLQVKI